MTIHLDRGPFMYIPDKLHLGTYEYTFGELHKDELAPIESLEADEAQLLCLVLHLKSLPTLMNRIHDC